MYEVPKNPPTRLHRIDAGEVRQEIVALRLTQFALNTATHNIYGILADQDGRLGRMERQLDLQQLAESQRPNEPK